MIPAVHARTAARHGGAADGAPTRTRIALVAMVLASGLASLFWAAVTLALPSIHHDLGATLPELQWTVTGAGLAFSASLILAGRLGDVHGRRRLLTVGFALLAVASAAAALATDVLVLILAVSLMGAAAAILTVVSLAVVTEAFGPGHRAAAIALWGGAGALAYGLGPAVGGLLAHTAGWRWIFWMYVPLALLALVLSHAAVRESRPAQAAAVDLRGAALLGAGLVGVSLVLSEGDGWGWTAPVSLALLVGGIVLLGAFFLREHRATSPLVDLGLFRIHAYLTTNLVLFCVNFVLGALLFFVPLYLQELQGDSPLSAGLQLLPLSAAMLIAMPLGGRLAERGHARAAIAVGVGIAAFGAWYLSGATAATSFVDLLPVLVVLGLGIGVAVTPINVTAMNAVPPTSTGTASGVLGTSRGLGTAIGVAASAALFQHLNVAGTVDAAAQRGVHLTPDGARSLDGLLASSDPARRAVDRLGADADQVLAAVREGFVSAFAGTLKLSAAVGVVAVILTVALLRHTSASVGSGRPQVRVERRTSDDQLTARPIVEPIAATRNTVTSTPITTRMTRSAGDA